MAGRTTRPEGESETGSAGRATVRPRRTQKERTAAAEHALLDAAESLFAQRGVEQTSLADVGQLAGYSRGLANHHFGSKAALVDALARRIQAGFVTDSDAAREIEGTDTDAVDVLANLVEGYLSAIGRHPRTSGAFFVMWGAAIPTESALRTVFATDDANFRVGVEHLVRAGQANGSVDDTLDPVASAVTVAGMVRGIAAQYLIAPDDVDLPAAGRAARRFLQMSLAPSHGV